MTELPEDLSTPDPMPDADPDNAAEELDEDRLGVDPLEQGVEPPERYTGADRFGTTPYEQSQGQDLEHRLREERPDVVEDEIEGPSGAGAAAPASADEDDAGSTSGAADDQLESVVDVTTGNQAVPVDDTT